MSRFNPCALYATISLAVIMMAGCAREPPFVLPDTTHQNVRSASRAISGEIAQKFKPFLNSWQKRQLVIGKIMNATTAEITVSGEELQWMLLLDLRNELPGVIVMDLSAAASLEDAIVIQGITQYVPNKSAAQIEVEASGTSRGLKINSKGGRIGQNKNQENSASWFQVNLAAIDLSSERKIGETRFFVNAVQFNPSPSRFYKDAPMYLNGARYREHLSELDGQGKALMEALQSDAVIVDAISDYERSDYITAENKFAEIINRDGKNLIAFSGLYQSLIKQGKLVEAERAFGALIGCAIAEDTLSVRLLFRVRSKELRDDGDLGVQYPIWIRQLARQVLISGRCVEINGHASNSGSAEFNDELSLLRAQWISEQMINWEPKLASRLHANGKGFRENIIGSGTDDALDAIDRRVDFVLTACRR